MGCGLAIEDPQGAAMMLYQPVLAYLQKEALVRHSYAFVARTSCRAKYLPFEVSKSGAKPPKGFIDQRQAMCTESYSGHAFGGVKGFPGHSASSRSSVHGGYSWEVPGHHLAHQSGRVSTSSREISS
jgi:hypothetical protein